MAAAISRSFILRVYQAFSAFSTDRDGAAATHVRVAASHCVSVPTPVGELPVDARRSAMSRRRLAICLIAAAGLCSCAASKPVPLPPPPSLPEVRFVPPCDPTATIGLTESNQRALIARDQALRAYIF